MKWRTGLILGALFLAPTVVLASSSYTSVESDVSASGGSSAYSEVNTTMYSSGSTSGGTSTVDIETNNNGVVNHEHEVVPVSADATVVVRVSTSSVTVSTSTPARHSSSIETWSAHIMGGFSRLLQNIFSWF